MEKGNAIVIDEIDNSLHPLLALMLINLFHDKIINKNPEVYYGNITGNNRD